MTIAWLLWFIMPIILGIISGFLIWKFLLEKPTERTLKMYREQEEEIRKLLEDSEE